MRLPLLLVSLFLGPSVADAQTIYLTPSEALKLVFKDSEKVVSEEKRLSLDQKREIEKSLGTPLAKKETWTFYVGRSGKRVDGYALIDQEIGKTEQITFLTAIAPDGKVQQVEILVYREPIGSEVKERRFLKQYEGKGPEAPMRLEQDIANVTGATMSSRAVTQGVRRALLLWKVFYGK